MHHEGGCRRDIRVSCITRTLGRDGHACAAHTPRSCSRRYKTMLVLHTPSVHMPRPCCGVALTGYCDVAPSPAGTQTVIRASTLCAHAPSWNSLSFFMLWFSASNTHSFALLRMSNKPVLCRKKFHLNGTGLTHSGAGAGTHEGRCYFLLALTDQDSVSGSFESE